MATGGPAADGGRTGAVLYTRAGCQFCVAAKALLLKRGFPFEEIDVTGDAVALERLTERSGLSTLPQLFVGRRLVGGFENIRRLDASGELASLLGGPGRR